MHMAFMIGSLTRGGSERVMTNLVDYFVKQGHEVTLVTQYQKENEYPLNQKARRIISDIAKEETGKSRILNFLKRFFKLRKIWKQEQPDAILVFIGKNNLMALLTSFGLHIPVVVSVRADPEQEYPGGFMRFLARHLFAHAAGVVLQTNRCKDFFPDKVRRKAVILHNPVNAEFFEAAYEGEREHTIVTVGRMDENKNQQLLIRSFAAILPQHSDFRLILYGSGESLPGLRTLVKELAIEEWVTFAGTVQNVAEQIRKAGVFVLSSNTEGMPNALLEAMVMGLPVIATDCPCGGPADLIDHKKNGLLTPVGNVKRMTENLQEMLNDLQKASKMGMEARKTCDIYRSERVYKEWYEYLLKIARGGAV